MDTQRRPWSASVLLLLTLLPLLLLLMLLKSQPVPNSLIRKCSKCCLQILFKKGVPLLMPNKSGARGIHTAASKVSWNVILDRHRHTPHNITWFSVLSFSPSILYVLHAGPRSCGKLPHCEGRERGRHHQCRAEDIQ